jgi:hypothetical protein
MAFAFRELYGSNSVSGIVTRLEPETRAAGSMILSSQRQGLFTQGLFGIELPPVVIFAFAVIDILAVLAGWIIISLMAIIEDHPDIATRPWFPQGLAMLPVEADGLLAFRIRLTREILALVLVGPLPLTKLDPLGVGIRPADRMLGP